MIGTHGRGAWVIDDIRPVRALAADPRLGERAVHLFPVQPVVQAQRALRGPYYFPGNAEFAGENRPYGALIRYWIGESAASDTAKAKLEVLDAQGRVVRELTGPRKEGLNQVTWNLREKSVRLIVPEGTPEEFLPQGLEVLPGRYTLRLTAGGGSVTETVDVLPDPRREVADEARLRKREALRQAGATLERVTDAVTRLQGTGKAIDFVQEMLRDTLRLAVPVDSTRRTALLAGADSVEKRLNELLDQLRLPNTTVGIVEDRSAASELGEIFGALQSSTDEPTAGQLDELRRREERMRRILAEVERFHATELATLRRELEAAGVGLFGPTPPA